MKNKLSFRTVLSLIALFSLVFTASVLSGCEDSQNFPELTTTTLPTTTTTTITTTTTTTLPQVATPVIRPAAGTYESNSLLVTAESATEGASVYFTSAGGASAASLSTSETTIDTSQTVRAVAVKSGYENSDPASANYELWYWLDDMSAGLADYYSVIFYCFDRDSSGTLYGGGQLDSISNSDYFASWDGSSWSVISGPDSNVIDLAVDNVGNVYVCGYFSSTASVPNTQYIAKWISPANGGPTWEALGSGVNNIVSALACDSSGNLYAGGYFTSASSVPNTNRIAKWTGTTWEALGSGIQDSYVKALAYHSSGNLYAGGNFTSASSVPNTNKIARWNVSGATWEALATGLDNLVKCLALDASGYPYAGGNFTQKVAHWDATGSTWEALGTAITSGNPESLAYDADNDLLYAGGLFVIPSFTSSALALLRWDGVTWESVHSEVGGEGQCVAITFDTDNGPIVAIEEAGNIGGVSLSRSLAHWGKKE
jgi:hypothetical protein